MNLAPGIFAGQTTFLVGNEKHAGKTTLLNFLLAMLRPAGSLAYMSVGVDGESSDALSGVPKPRIMASAGDWLVTAQQALDQSDLAAEIHDVFSFDGVMGRPVLVRVLRGGPIELVGPGTNAQLSEILPAIAKHAGTTLVDGAINRITQVSAGVAPAFVYIVRVHRATLSRAVGSIRRLARLGEVPLALPDRQSLTLEGALTAEKAAALGRDCTSVVVEDLAHVFLGANELEAFCRRRELRFVRRIEMRAIVAVLHDVDREELIDRIADTAIAGQIAFNPYQEAA